MNWRLHHDAAKQVAARAPAHGLHALVTQAEDPARLCFGRNLQCDITVQRGNFNRAPESGGCKADRYLAAQMLAVPFENRVLAYADFNIEVTRWPAVAARLAFAAQADPISGIDTRWHFD